MNTPMQFHGRDGLCFIPIVGIFIMLWFWAVGREEELSLNKPFILIGAIVWQLFWLLVLWFKVIAI